MIKGKRRCQILLDLDENASGQLTQIEIAKTFGVSSSTVSNVVSAYIRGGINSIVKINRNTRQNAKCKVDGRLESELICVACDPASECLHL